MEEISPVAFKKYPDVANKLPKGMASIPEGAIVEITEKVDSSNFRFWVGEWKFGSRERELEDGSGNFKAAISTLKSLPTDVKTSLKIDFGHLIFYGEAMTGLRGNEIRYEREIPGGVAWFGAFDTNSMKWLVGAEKIIVLKVFAEQTGTTALAPEYIGPWPSDEKLAELLARPSRFGGNREGIVVKGYTDDLCDPWGHHFEMKLVNADFREKKNNTKKEQTERADPWMEIAKQYATPMRVAKAVTRMKDNGSWNEQSEEKNIGPLIGTVAKDILKEEEDAIKDELFRLFCKRVLTSAVAPACRDHVLKREVE